MSDDHLRAILTTLRVSKQSGELDKQENLVNENVKWRNSLDYYILEKAIKHHDVQIRLDTLALLVESKRSTLNFTKAELDIITLFLKYNLSEKIEYVPLLKKSLRRLKDSFAVMQRQLTQEEKARHHGQKTTLLVSNEFKKALAHSYKTSNEIQQQIDVYNTFIMTLRDFCVNNLYPDATYCRRRASLQILCLMQDIVDNEFKNIKWTFGQTEKIFQCLLLDTYDSNKEMAYNILVTVPRLSISSLDSNERITEMIDIAMQLGNSIRPIDCVTATYILRLSTLSPVINDVLNVYLDMKKNCIEASTPVIIQLLELLMQKLEEPLISAKKNIVFAVSQYSLYGYIFCIRTLLNCANLSNQKTEVTWQKTIAKVISMCFELADVASSIVSNSSPEGYLPMDFSDHTVNNNNHLDKMQLVTPQILLLCAWRTVKEVSRLFGDLTSTASICNKENNEEFHLLTEHQVLEIGEHLVALLQHTKHRGAFEQAHIGFSQLCTRLWRLENPRLNQLPKIWLHQILLAITGSQQTYSKLCATRRSAGLPFMVQALVSSEPHSFAIPKITTLDSIMKILIRFATLENDIDLSQNVQTLIYENTVFLYSADYINTLDVKLNVHITEIRTHALNILRALFRHSPLKDSVQKYIADGLIAAFKSYDGNTWTERNAATLLFSALIIRIFGVQRTKDHINLTQENKMTCKVFFERYPNTLDFIIKELRTFVINDDKLVKSNVQCILMLLSRLYACQNFEDSNFDYQIKELVDLISQCAKSRVYKTRELAARALAPLLTKTSYDDTMKKILYSLAFGQLNQMSLNTMHGYMLQILEIIKQCQWIKYEMGHLDFYTFLNGTDWILKGLNTNNGGPCSFPLATTYINVLYKLMKINNQIIHPYFLQTTFSIVKRHLLLDDALKTGPGSDGYKVSIINFILSLSKNPTLSKKVCGWNVPARLYLHTMTTSEPMDKIILWSMLTNVITTTQCAHEKQILINRGIDFICNCTHFLYKYNPVEQDSIFDFLYLCLVHINLSSDISGLCEKHEIIHLVLEKIRMDNNMNCYCRRSSYLRLIGKAYLTLLQDAMVKHQKKEKYADVFTSFCDYSWISLLDIDYRVSVFEIFYDISQTCLIEDNYFILQWWTTLLRLLVDDNIEIRQAASTLISRIEPSTELYCNISMQEIFFKKFYNHVSKTRPGVALIALFHWSVSLLDENDIDMDMDENSVFSKCKNYNWFEPVQMSNKCLEVLRQIIEYTSMNDPLPTSAIQWLNNQLNFDFPSTTCFYEILLVYKKSISFTEGNLRDALDPMYKDKLLQQLTYEKYVCLIEQKHV